METLEEILGSLDDKAVEYQKAINATSALNGAQIKQFQILSNSIGEINEQLQAAVKARKELRKEGEADILETSTRNRMDASAILDMFSYDPKIVEDELENLGLVEDLSGQKSGELRKTLASAFALQGTAEVQSLEKLLNSDIPGYGNFIRKNLSLDKLIEGDLTGFRDQIATLINSSTLLFDGVGDAVTSFQNTVKDTEKTASQFVQKFLPKTQATDLINSL